MPKVYLVTEDGVYIDITDFATDTTLATLATETTLNGIKTQTDKLTFDGSNNLKTVVG